MPIALDLPKNLYYVTIHFENGFRQTPHFFLWDNVDTAFKEANRNIVEAGLRYKRLSARKLVFKESYEITKDFYHEVPFQDSVEWSPELNQEMIENGEKNIPNVLVVVLDYQDKSKKLNLFLDEWYNTNSVEQAKILMKKSNMPLIVPSKHAHLYEPTTEVVWTGWN